MKSQSGTLRVLHLTTHVRIGGITRYLMVLGKTLSRRGLTVAVLSSGGALFDAMKDLGIQSYELPIRTKSEIHPKLLVALPRVVRLVKSEGFHLMHAHTRVTQVLAAMVSKITGVPYITTAHGFYKPRLGRKWLGCWGRRVIAVSDLVAEDLVRSHGVAPDRVRTVLNAIDIDDFEKRLASADGARIRREHGIPESAFVIGSVSRLVEDKGHAYLIRAFKILEQRRPDIFLVVVGEGREKESLRSLVLELGLEKKVLLRGAVDDVTTLLPCFDAFVHAPTYREGFGLSIAEAMIAGKPVVATDIRAINTLVRDGQTGFLVPAKSVNELADALCRLIDDPSHGRAVAENGRREARAMCSPERMADEVEAVYREVCGQNLTRSHA